MSRSKRRHTISCPRSCATPEELNISGATPLATPLTGYQCRRLKQQIKLVIAKWEQQREKKAKGR